MRNHNSVLLGGVCLLVFSSLVSVRIEAQTVPPLINYQGKLVSSNGLPVSTGDYELRFRIWDAATGGNLVWGPQVFNGQSGPGFGPLVPVVQGWFNVMLGPVATNSVPIANAFTGTNRFMEIQLGTNASFSPRQQVLSAPYALRSGTSETANRAMVADFAQAVASATTTNGMLLYVSTNGLNTNNGLTPATAKRTIQAAVDAIPDRIAHGVEIHVFPGVYRETVKVLHKTILNTTGAYLSIYGVGMTAGGNEIPTDDGSVLPEHVVIDGADSTGGPPVRTMGVQLEGGGLSLNKLSIRNTTQTGVYVAGSGVLGASSLSISNTGGSGFNMLNQSRGVFEDCVLEGPFGDAGWVAEMNALLLYRNDHTFAYDPTGAINNSVRNSNRGIHVVFGSTAISATSVTFSNVTENIVSQLLGRYD